MKQSKTNIFYTLLVILFVLAVILVVPIFAIMSLNTLFGLGISLNIWTWLSAAMLISIITVRNSK